MTTDTNPAANESTRPRKLALRPAFLAIAALVAAGVIGFSFNPSVPPAVAETAEAQQTIETPYGRAPLSFADLVAKVSPAVVSINVKGEVKTVQNDGSPIPGMPNVPEDNPLHDFFKQFRKGMPKPPSKHTPSLAQGSGFFISEDGYVVTNNHVVEDADNITVTMEDGEKFDAKLIGTDPRTDLALVKVTDKTSTKFPFVTMSDKRPRVGDWVLAVGNPFGLGGTVTAGIISAHNRDIGSGPYDYLQIDAAVNRGNSGGPSFDLDGNVVHGPAHLAETRSKRIGANRLMEPWLRSCVRAAAARRGCSNWCTSSNRAIRSRCSFSSGILATRRVAKRRR